MISNTYVEPNQDCDHDNDNDDDDNDDNDDNGCEGTQWRKVHLPCSRGEVLTDTCLRIVTIVPRSSSVDSTT